MNEPANTHYYTVRDTVTPKLIEKRELRKQEEEARARKKDDVDTMEYSIETTDSDLLNDEEYIQESDETLTKRIHRRTRWIGTNIFIPPDILRNEMIVSVSFLRELISVCGGDASRVALNYRTAYR